MKYKAKKSNITKAVVSNKSPSSSVVAVEFCSFLSPGVVVVFGLVFMTKVK
jgi:hypothetical protein